MTSQCQDREAANTLDTTSEMIHCTSNTAAYDQGNQFLTYKLKILTL